MRKFANKREIINYNKTSNSELWKHRIPQLFFAQYIVAASKLKVFAKLVIVRWKP